MPTPGYGSQPLQGCFVRVSMARGVDIRGWRLRWIVSRLEQCPAQGDPTWSTALPPSSHAVRAGPRSKQPRSRTTRFPPNTVRQPDRVPSVRPIDEQPPGPSRSCAGACRFEQRSAILRRTASVSWLVNACRALSAYERPIYRVFLRFCFAVIEDPRRFRPAGALATLPPFG